MIEIVVAMFVLAILALSFLPVLTTNAVAARQNSEIATATQIVASQLEAARGQGGSCASVAAFATATTATVDGRSYDIARTNPGSCTAPGTATVEVAVSLPGTSQVLARARTRLFVGSAS